MQRVRADFLIQGEEGKLRFGGEPFSGLAYQVGLDFVLERIDEVAGGAIAGPSADWLPLPEGGSRVDSASLQLAEDYGPRLFEGSPFTGIAYSFTHGGICFAETEYVGGYETEQSARKWYPTGEPKVLIGGGEYTSWFVDGRLQRKGVQGELMFGLNFADDGRLGSLVLRDRGLLDLESLRRLRAADEFMILGAAVDTDLLRVLRDRTGIGAVSKLRLVETGLDESATDVLASFENLNEIWLDDNPGLGIPAAHQIELRRPGCRVHVAIPDESEA